MSHIHKGIRAIQAKNQALTGSEAIPIKMPARKQVIQAWEATCLRKVSFVSCWDIFLPIILLKSEKIRYHRLRKFLIKGELMRDN